MKIIEPYQLKNLDLTNRLVMAPMCMYQVKTEDGMANDFHLVHYGARALGQVGLIILEATAVLANGRITDYDLGIYQDQHIEPLKKIVDVIHQYPSKVAIQLAHAGRKSTTTQDEHYAPSIAETNQDLMPYVEMNQEQIHEAIDAFRKAAQRADQAGFDAIEIHGAHGYLIHQFLSPLSNQRTDRYGQDRVLFLQEVLQAVKEVWPKEKSIILRVSATDYHPDGLNVEGIIEILLRVKDLIDGVHVSSGGIVNAKIDLYPGYQLDLAKKIKEQVKLPTIGVGLLKTTTEYLQALEEDTCDLVASGREILRNPNLMLDIYKDLKQSEQQPFYYHRAYK